VKKINIPLLTVITVAVIFLASVANYASKTTTPYLGDADAIGTDEDMNARANYEQMILQDPATGMIPAHIRERELAFASNLPSDKILSALAKTTSLTWQSRGPWNVGGRTRAFAIDVSNENILVAGSCSGGMWRSTDQGATWTPTTTPTQYKSVTCLAQDKRAGHTNVWYYGSGEAYGASASVTGASYLGNGIYKSTDDGLTWNVLPSATTSSFTTYDIWSDLIWNVVTNQADAVNDVVYAAACGGIYKTTDGGTTWSMAKGTPISDLSKSYFTDVAITSTGVVYATLSSEGSQKGIYRSIDGITFTNITPSGFPSFYNRIKIGISPSNENQVYILGNTPGFGLPDTNFLGQVEWNSLWRYTYISGDGSGTGGSWSDRSANLPASGGLFDKFTCQGSYDLVVKVKPNDTNTVFIGGTNLYRSTSAFADNTHTSFIGGYQQGATLPVVNMYANHHPDQHELVFLPSNNNKMFSSNDGGIFRTDDNTASTVSWTSLNNGYLTTMFYTCAIDHATTNDIIIGGAQDNGSWYTNSASPTTPWVTPRGGDGSFCAIADSGNAYYFSIQNGKVMRAKLNASGHVDSFARIDPIGGNSYLFVNPYTIDPNNNNIMYLAGGRALWRNNNLSGIPYAGNWDSISKNWVVFPDSLSSTQITAVTVSKTPANRVYFGTSAKKVYRIDSANIGTHIKKDITSYVINKSFPGGGSVSCIAVDPNNADNVMVVFSNYAVYSIYYSSDGGTTWSKVAGNLEANALGTGDGPSCRWASIIPVTDGYVYLVGTSVGLFATNKLNDTSTVWVQQGTSTIGADIVDMIDYRTTDGLVVVATHSHGIFSSHISSINDVLSVPQTFTNNYSLNLTTYPNPFAITATIHFNLLKKENVCIQVYDVLGRLVDVVANEQMEPGERNLIFNGNNLQPGTYYCMLKAGDQTASKQMVFTR